MQCVRNVSRVCRHAHGACPGAPAAPSAQPLRRHVRTAASGNALVVGGGFAGLAAADVLAKAGLDVVLVEQGRGLGGRTCTRTVTLGSHGERLTFDHGCQYLSPRSPLFEATLEELRQMGAVAQWLGGRPVGSAHLAEDGTVDMASFDVDASKSLWVGTPTNSAVGRALAARAGPRLSTLTATRVERLRWDPAAGVWTVSAKRTGGGGGGGGGAAGGGGVDEAVAKLQSSRFDLVVTAMSSVSTARLLEASSSSPNSSSSSSTSSSTPSSSSSTAAGSSGEGGAAAAGAPLAPEVVEAARGIRSNVCWALMVALNKKIEVPYDGVLLSRPDPAGGAPQYGPIAWLARDSSKPGRPAVSGGDGEAWVVHGGPDWSNARREVAPAEVARELLRDFAHLVQTPISDADVVHMEAHRWNNAYPLNPRPPQPLPNELSGSSSSGGDGGGLQLAGHFMLRPEMRLGVCGDWCKGPRAADAYVTGWEAAQALLLQL